MHATPTKPEYAEVGPELVRYAAEHAAVPFFAIGGIDAGNVGEVVVGAGAERVAVVRAIRDADDPGAVARALRDRVEAAAPAGAALMAGREKAKRERKRRRAHAEAADGRRAVPRAVAPRRSPARTTSRARRSCRWRRASDRSSSRSPR